MSLITGDPEDSPRHCATKHHHRRRRLLVAAWSAAMSLVALAIILWLTLRPSAPRFTLLAATASVDDNSNATMTGGIARLDAAFMAHNPNARAAALYDRLQARASYGAGVQLAAGPLPPFEQTQGDAVLTTSLASSSSAVLGAGVATETEAAAGGRPPTTTLLRVRVEGQLRWKVATWVSGRHALVAECVAVVVLQSNRAVVVQGSQCATTLE